MLHIFTYETSHRCLKIQPDQLGSFPQLLEIFDEY